MERIKLRHREKLRKILRVRLRHREKLNFIPEWTGSIEGYAVNHIKKHLWRMRNKYEFEDLYQEAFIAFDQVKKHYPYVRTPQHFMALYKTTLWHHFVDLGTALTKKAHTCFCELGEDLDAPDWESGVEANCFSADDVELVLQMQDAPALLIPIFQHFCDVEEVQRLLDHNDIEVIQSDLSARKKCKSIKMDFHTLQGDELYWEIIRRYVCKMKGQDYHKKKSFQVPISLKNRISIKQLLLRWYHGKNIQS